MNQKTIRKEIVDNEEGIKLDHQSHLVIFDNFTHNGRLYSHLSNLEPLEWNKVVHQIIDKGIIVECSAKTYDFEKDFELHQNQVSTRLNEQLVEVKSFLEKFSKENVEKVSKELQEVSAQFDIKNKDSKISKTVEALQKTLLETYGKDSLLYKDFMQLFSIEQERSPLSLFLKEVGNKFKEINEQREKETKELKEKIENVEKILIVEKKTNEIFQRSASKGKDHENNVEAYLRKIAEPYADIVQEVATRRGSDNRTIGDFDVELSDSGIISIEAKDDNSKTPNMIQKEIKATLSNRQSDFVIYVFKMDEQIPQNMERFTLQKNAIICSLENNQLYLAYRLARKIVEITQKHSSVDLAGIKSDVEEMREEMHDLNYMSRNASSLVNTSNKLKDSLVLFIGRYEDRLTQLLEKLNSQEVKA